MVDLVIPVYKPRQEFLKLLTMIQKQTSPIHKIIIMNTEKKYWDEFVEQYKEVTMYDNLEVHHIFHGPNRKKSEHWGLKVRLCMHCHRDNKKGVHSDHQFDLDLKRYAQTLFETKYSHNLFVQEFGKNYLSIEEEEDCSM